MGEKMTLKEAVLQAEPHRMMRGDSGRYPDGTCWGQTSSVDGFWLPLEAWQTVMAHLTQPAQAVDVEKVREVIEQTREYYERTDDRRTAYALENVLSDIYEKFTAALPKDSNHGQ